MILLRKEEGRLVFRLSAAERQLLSELLSHYPCIPPGHHARARVAPHAGGEQPADALRLLEESLEEHRAVTRRQIQVWLADPARIRAAGPAYELKLDSPEVELLLQVLNDIRVGSWIALGEPDEKMRDFDPEKTPQAWTMELAGYFQMFILDSLES